MNKIRSYFSNIKPIRYFYDDLYLRFFSNRVPSYLHHYKNILYSPYGSGFSQLSEIHRLARMGYIRNKRVLIIGVENGTEIIKYWVKEKPAQLVGIDIGDYEDEWNKILPEIESKYPDVYCFKKMDAAQLDFPNEHFDLIYSQGVLPHIIDMPSFLKKASEILSPDGIFYAFCCPLWWTYGGPHVGSLGFEHLLLSEEEFFVKAMTVGSGEEYWLEKGLFNRLRFRDLLSNIKQYFNLERVGIIGSPQVEKFKNDNPQTWTALLEKYDEEDLSIRLSVFIGCKKN